MGTIYAVPSTYWASALLLRSSMKESGKTGDKFPLFFRFLDVIRLLYTKNLSKNKRFWTDCGGA